MSGAIHGMQMGGATPKLKIEFLGGDEIQAACREAVLLAARLDLLVVFDFNGVHVMARGTTDPRALAEAWQRALTTGGSAGPKVASA